MTPLEAAVARLRARREARPVLRVAAAEGLIGPIRVELNERAYALRGRLSAGRGGELDAQDSAAAEELEELAARLEALVGDEAARLVERRSGLTWSAFVGHCLIWWLGDSQGTGLVRALKARLEDHGVVAELRWAEGQGAAARLEDRRGLHALLGGLAGLALSQLWGADGPWWAPWPITTALGAAAGYATSAPRWRCTTLTCGQGLSSSRLSTCPRCGAHLRFERPPARDGLKRGG